VPAWTMREWLATGRFPVGSGLLVRLPEWDRHLPLHQLYPDQRSAFVLPPAWPNFYSDGVLQNVESGAVAASSASSSGMGTAAALTAAAASCSRAGSSGAVGSAAQAAATAALARISEELLRPRGGVEIAPPEGSREREPAGRTPSSPADWLSGKEQDHEQLTSRLAGSAAGEPEVGSEAADPSDLLEKLLHEGHARGPVLQ